MGGSNNANVQDVLSFIGFDAFAELIEASLEIVNDQPISICKLKLSRRYKLSSEREEQIETWNVKLTKQTLRQFDDQIRSYFSMNDGETLLPRVEEFKNLLRDTETLSNMTPNSFIGTRLTGQDGAENEVVGYVNYLLKSERLLFCPLVRAFLKFDRAVETGG